MAGEITPIRPKAAPARAGAQDIAELVAFTDARLLAPFRALDRVYEAAGRDWYAAMHDAHQWPITADHLLLAQERGARGLEALSAKLGDRLEKLPARDVLLAAMTPVAAALAAPVDARQTRLLLAQMADAFPQATAQAHAGYFETLAFDVAAVGFGPSIVAAATTALRRRSTFLPAIAEVLVECATQREELAFVQGLLRRALDARDAAEACAAEVEHLRALRIGRGPAT